ncbi:7-cyano-7-deazaguanine synthase QueC [Candidatus Palauibacter polyketidifaciens]|uniref:7-cyano-7-deazaguanine synthase QueC n=1 Tax=Candidatus Palauibacter polyketidifaciens TaxID=3056740 RepID=UPI002390D445|nr:7-cyano-7-deazaguanine synthase QueC [Candidatus Palauibacter polyketidifaciens]MDE2719993.1 7-cyano-7-deazaguanine synthase QueC [Candidatus Palauibacter polyketidifaciens]
MDRRAVVLLSGGLDSATTLAIAVERGYRPYALTLRYGQRHELEVDAACRLAEAMRVVRHVITAVDLRAFGGSALTGDLEVPRGPQVAADSEDIPVTYVPARNTIFLSMALAWAEALQASDIFIGVNAVDYSGYPDCRPEFLDAFEKLAGLGTKAGVEGNRPFRIHAPLIDLTKAEIIRRGLALGVDYGMTRSCYDPDESGAACGECDSCRLRLAGFAAAGVRDPAPYQSP